MEQNLRSLALVVLVTQVLSPPHPPAAAGAAQPNYLPIHFPPCPFRDLALSIPPLPPWGSGLLPTTQVYPSAFKKKFIIGYPIGPSLRRSKANTFFQTYNTRWLTVRLSVPWIECDHEKENTLRYCMVKRSLIKVMDLVRFLTWEAFSDIPTSASFMTMAFPPIIDTRDSNQSFLSY